MKMCRIITLTLALLLLYGETAEARGRWFNFGRRQSAPVKTYSKPRTVSKPPIQEEKEISLPPAPKDIRPYDMMSYGTEKKRYNYTVF